MPNKKINQLDTRVNAALTDYLVVADPSTGYAYKELGSTFVDLAKTTLVPYTGATASVNLGEYGLTAGQLTLDTSPTGTAVVGTTRWNDTIGSSETLLKGGNVLLKDGVDLVARVVNKVTPSTTLTKAAYKAVRVSGAQGQRLAVAYAQANNDNNSADTIGLVCETIAANQEGFIITVGQLLEVNTTGSLQGETWADGDVLYLSPTTAGNLTNIKPTGATGHIVVIGYVEYAHAVHGSIYVKVMNGWELDELHNCYINAPANNEVLTYESATSLWKNKSIATVLGYTPANDSLVMHLAGTETATGVKTFSIGLATTTGDNFLNTSSGNLLVGYSATPATNTYKLNVNGTTYLGNNVTTSAVHTFQSNVGGGNTFVTFLNQAGGTIGTITNGGLLTWSGTTTFSNTIGFNGKIGSSGTGGIAIVPGGVPSTLSTSQIMLLVAAPLNNYTSTYGLNEQGIFLGGTYNGGQGPTRLVLGPSLYYNNGSVATGVWDFSITPASGQVTDGYGSSLILAGGRGRGTGTPGKFIVQTSTATTTGTTLQTLSNRLEVDGTGQLKLNNYTSTTSFTGTVAGLLGFDSSGNIITTSASGGGISGSGTAGQVTYWTGTSAVGGSADLTLDTTLGRLNLTKSVNGTAAYYVTNASAGSSAVASFSALNGTTTVSYGVNGTNTASYGALSANNGFFYSTRGIVFMADSAANGILQFATGGNTERMRLWNTGNLVLQNGGTFTDSGYRLDVNGTGASTGALRVTGGSTLLVGGGNTSATNALVVQNSSSQTLLSVKNNGQTTLTGTTSNDSTTIFRIEQNGGNGRFLVNAAGQITIAGDNFQSNESFVSITRNAFNPTSGGTSHTSLLINPNINQTGGANGITRGLYVNPTLTAAADFRAIETTNGKIVFGNLPTSSAGLPTGALWNNLGVINIV